MITKFNTYNEEFNWNLFKKKKVNKPNNTQHIDIDPYSEEIWEEDKISYMDDFIKFLIQNNALDKFKNNLIYSKFLTMDDLPLKFNPESYIFRAFDWSYDRSDYLNMLKSYRYWDRLNNKWIRKLNKLKLNENIHYDIDPYNEENWEDNSIKDKFINFLKDNNAYEKYIENLKVNNFFENARPINYLDGAFYFHNTPQGMKYWADLNFMWRNNYAF